MKLTKSLLLLLLIGLLPRIVAAQVNISSAGYTLNEMEIIASWANFNTHQAILEKRGFKFITHSTKEKVYAYQRKNETQLYVSYEQTKVIDFSFFNGKQNFEKVMEELMKSGYVKKTNEAGETIYRKGAFEVFADPDEYMMFISRDPSSLPNTQTSSSTKIPQPQTASSTNNQPEIYYSAKEIADALNANIQYALLETNGYKANYRLGTAGAMSSESSYVMFFSKANVLYYRIYINRDQCKEETREIKVKFTGSSASSDTGFTLVFRSSFVCADENFIFLTAKFTVGDGFTKDGVKKWITDNTFG